MNMRTFMNLFEMSQSEARQVFFMNGVDTERMDKPALKSAYRKLMMKHHPDKGGDLDTAKQITAAYSALEGSVGAQTADSHSQASPQPRSAAYSMDHPQFSHIDYVKWYFDQLSAGHPSQNWTVMNFDGHFFRNGFTIQGRADLFSKMASVLRQWDRHYDCRAVMVGTRAMLEKGTLLVINVDGKDVRPFITLHFDSMNSNPANDQKFCRQLPQILDAIADDSFVSQNMMD
jgi:hypothetical protein